MKRLLFAVAVACLFAANALAADPPATSSPTPVPTGTVIVPGTPTVMTTTGTTTRRFGLFSRLRNRMSGANYSTPTSGVIVAPTAPATSAPGVVPSPMPMPTTKPVETAVTGSGVVTASGSGVVAGTTTTSMMPMTTTTTRTRMGLLQRLRMRRGM